MPLLDVSEVLGDPLFAEAGPVLRRRNVETVGSDGFSVRSTSEDALPASTVVTQDSTQRLARDPEGRMAPGVIILHTTGHLIAGDGATDADVVIWQGRSYTVTAVNDWSTWGAGFVTAVAELIRPDGGTDVG